MKGHNNFLRSFYWFILISFDLFILTTIFSSCGSNLPTVKVVPVEEQIIPEWQAPAYENFWDAIGDFNPSYVINEFPKKSDEHKFAEALNHLLNGDMGRSEHILMNLSQSSNDSLICVRSYKLLNDLLKSQFKWKQYAELKDIKLKFNVNNSEGRDIISKAFVSAPKEHYVLPKKPVVLPVKKSPMGHLLVEVKVNERKYDFMLDTGAGMTVLSSDVAKACGINALTEEKLSARAPITSVDVWPAIINTLQIGELSVKNHPSIIIKSDDLRFKAWFIEIFQIQGILGWPFIRNFCLEIDMPNNRIIFSSPINRAENKRNLFCVGSFPIIRLKGLDGTLLNFGLDTGGKACWLSPKGCKKLSLFPSKEIEETTGGVGGVRKMKMGVIENFSVYLKNNRLEYSEVQIGQRQSNYFKCDGRLGLIGMNSKLIIDYTNGYCEITQTNEE